MNKSKFLKKSLAAVLAVLMVVAMIPLSAAAASTDYKPDGLEITGPNGEKVSGTGNSFTLNLQYTPNPVVRVSTRTPDDDFVVIREKIEGGPIGSEDTNYNDNPATIPLQVDKKKPVQFRFYVKNGDNRSAEYTVDWTVATPATSGKATGAMLDGKFKGEINESAKTITFTVPFGFVASGHDSYYVDFDGCTDDRITANYLTEGAATNGAAGSTQGNGTVGTNMLKPTSQVLTAETEDGQSDVQYTVYVKEETGLTGIKIGDLKTEVEIATADGTNALLTAAGAPGDYHESMETGTIKVYVPSTLEPVDGKVKLIPELSISDPNTHAQVEVIDGSGPTTKMTDIVDGEGFDFSLVYGANSADSWKADATCSRPNGVNMILTSTNGAKRTYILKFVRWEDTELTSVKAVDGHTTPTWNTVDGTISGSNIEIVVPKNADLSDVDLTFTGPRNFGWSTTSHPGSTDFDSSAKVVVKEPTTGGTPGSNLGNGPQNFNNKGVAPNIEGINYSKPVEVVVTSDDGNHQKVYTLTIKPIGEDTVVPTITAVSLTLNKGASTEAIYRADITQGDEPTVTFTVPHSTSNDEILHGVYDYARSHQATTVNLVKPNNFANTNNGYIEIISATGNAVKYKIVFKRAPARTGKAISDFVLSTEAKTGGNWNLTPYNNNRNYNVTVSNGKFTVTVPAKNTFSANFKLSDGAKLYKYTPGSSGTKPNYGLAEVLAVKSDGTIQAEVDLATETTAATATTYFVASEELATMITNGDSKLLKQGATGVTLADIDVDVINNKYSSLITKYTWNVIVSKSVLTRMTNGSFTDVQGNIKSEITNTQDGVHTIELTVPHSYVVNASNQPKEFFATFTLSPGATLGIINQSVAGTVSSFYPIFNGGKKDYTTKVEAADTAFNSTIDCNLAFKVVETTPGSGKYKLQVGGDVTGTGDTFADVANATEGTAADYYLYVLAEDGKTLEQYNVAVKKADAKAGAQVTELTVNGANASINHTAKTITANVPYGTNLGQIKIALKASEMAQVGMGKASNDGSVKAGTTYDTATGKDYFDKEVAGTYDLRNPLKIEVKSESTLPQVTNVYTLTVKAGEQFTDVPANAWFAPYVKEAVDKGIVNGRGDSTFGPYDNITREDFAVMTGRMLGIKVDENATVPFTDASSVSDYAKGYVAYFAKEGIIGGYEDSTFRPKGYITREEAAKILAVALDLEVTGTPTFVDTNKISSWARSYVAAVQTAKIFNGDEANRFNGTTRITRAETAKVMVESLKK